MPHAYVDYEMQLNCTTAAPRLTHCETAVLKLLDLQGCVLLLVCRLEVVAEVPHISGLLAQVLQVHKITGCAPMVLQ